MAGWLCLPEVSGRPGRPPEVPGLHVRMPRLRAPDVDHIGNHSTQDQVAADRLVLDSAPDRYALERHLGRPIGEPDRRQRRHGLAPSSQISSRDDRP